MKIDYDSLTQAVRDLRKLAGLNQTEFGRRMGVSHATAQRYERFGDFPQGEYEMLAKLAHFAASLGRKDLEAVFMTPIARLYHGLNVDVIPSVSPGSFQEPNVPNAVLTEIEDERLRNQLQSVLSSGDSNLISLVHVVIQAAADLCAKSSRASADSSVAGSEATGISRETPSPEGLKERADRLIGEGNEAGSASDGRSKKRRRSGGGSTAS